MRCLNARLSLQHRLPNELWCNVWELLSDVDRVSVTRVCSHWRALCHGFPRLSTDLLFYTTCHSHWCRCPECTGSIEEKDHNPSGWEINPYPKTSTNVASAVDALSRSRSLPLHITFDIVPFRPNLDVVTSLLDALLPHSGRLASLRLRVCNPNDTADFLSRFDALPALRVLELDVGADDRRNPLIPGVNLKTSNIAFPVLEELHVRTEHISWTYHVAVHYPALRKVTTCLHSFYNIIPLLRTCPNLRALCLQLPSSSDVRRATSRIQDELQTLVRSVPLTDVQVSGIRNGDAFTCLLPTFEPLSLQHFALGVDSWCNYGIPWQRILDQLGDDIHLSYTRTRTSRDLRGTDRDGRTRRIWKTLRSVDPYNDFLTGSFWLPWRRTVSLSMDAKEWRALILCGLSWPRLETLSIVFSEHTDIGTVSHGPSASGTNQFSALRFVTVVIVADDVQVTAENVAAALRLLRLATPLEQLSLDKRIQEHDGQLFASFAKDIRLD
ncbi:hypothetical protein AURDEDRAFT_167624 [Auricularia subglabra TFB-10046 SS5]|nr:hypothetical protein AURDEDRAFT_167624 [Auricularia subglabra TFB-10046 SS5]